MPVDARIALGVEPVQLPDFASLAVKRADMMNSMSEMASRQRAVEEKNAFTTLLQMPGASLDDPEFRKRAMLSSPSLAPTYFQNYDQANAAQAVAKKEALAQKDAETSSAMSELFQYRDFDSAKAGLERRVAGGQLSREQADSVIGLMGQFDDYDKFAAHVARSRLSDEQRLQVTRGTRDTGVAIEDTAVGTFADPSTPLTVTGTTMKQMSPTEVAANEVAKTNAATARMNAKSLNFSGFDGAGVSVARDPQTGAVVSQFNGTPTGTGGKSPLTKKTAVEQFDTAMQAMRDAYVKLDDMNALVVSGDAGGINPLTGKADTKGGNMFENLARSAAASDVGQWIAGSMGAPEQTQRDNIANLRFTLINTIKGLQDIGAKGLDSNVELQNALKTLSSPGQSRETIASTMSTIEKIFRQTVASLPDNAGATGSTTTAPPKTIKWDDL